MKKLLLTLTFCVATTLSFSACNKPNTNNTNSKPQPDVVQKGTKPQPDSEVAVIETNDFGKIVIELYPNVAPKMVERFKALIKDGTYNGTTFHRIDPSLGIIQGGDPLSKDADPTNDGTGDSKLPDLTAEFSDIQFETGTVASARQGGNNNSANCQFFITLRRQPSFEMEGNRYTIFGKVIQGMTNVNTIAGAPKAEGAERPDPPIVVKSMTLEPRTNYVK